MVVVDKSPGPDRAEHGNTLGATATSGPAADGANAVAATPDPLGGHLDGAEYEHIDGKDPLRFNNWLRHSATGAVITGISLGLQRALELPRKQPAFVIEASDEPYDPSRPIDLRFDPDSPADTVAIIRSPAAPHDPGSPTTPR